MAPPTTQGRSPSRLRSKTSDLSDLLHGRHTKPGGHSTDTDVPPLPNTGPLDATPPKPKRKLAGFLARRRKSGIVGRDDDWTPVEDYNPAVPEALARSRIPSNPSSSLPASLPPLNVSPPSFSAHFPSSPSAEQPSPQRSRLSTALGLPDTSTASTSAAVKHLSSFRNVRPQKSSSFEVSMPFNVTHMATASNMAMLNGTSPAEQKPKVSSSSVGAPSSGRKPVITVSAPPSAADSEVERDMYIVTRPAPAPPPPPSSRAVKEHSAKKSLGFGFAKKEKDDGASTASDRERSSKDKHKQRSLDKEKQHKDALAHSPAPSLTPVLPQKMQFPVPPSSRGSRLAVPGVDNALQERTLGAGAQVVPTLTDAFQSPASSSFATVSPHTATPSPRSDSSPSPVFPGGRSNSSGLAVPPRPLRPTSLIIPGSGSPRPRANSANTLTASSMQAYHYLNQPPSSPSSPTGNTAARPLSRLRAHRASRTPSPAPTSPHPPPRSPLPSPPVSMTSFPMSSDAEPEGWSTDASTRLGHGGWSTDASASTRVGSAGGGRKLSLIGLPGVGLRERVRANTITNVGGPRHTYGLGSRYAHVSGVSSGEETPFSEADETRNPGARASSMKAGTGRGAKGGEVVASCLPAFTHKEKEKKDTRLVVQTRPSSPAAQSQRSHSQDTANTGSILANTGSGTTPTRSSAAATPTEDVGTAPGLRAAHDTFVRILQDKHASEKADLLKRIERLEREARKREREIKGLRWLVMNATGAAGDGSFASLIALDEQLATGRLRSGSKSSEVSVGCGSLTASTSSEVPSARTGSSATRARPSLTGVFGSPPDSQYSEEPGELIIELQSAVSDLISPVQAYMPPMPTADGQRPDSFGTDLRRSNTLPDVPSGAQPKSSRRTSSPVLPTISSKPSTSISSGQHGLGFDIPSIPGSSSDMSLATLALGDVADASIPSLTATNTASSTSSLSAIPEITSFASSYELQQHERERLEKEERRASRALKRISASSSSSSGGNVKVGMSPSIGQVLDQTRELDADVDVDETGMDEVLRKLRAFGGAERGSGGAERDS